MLIRQIRESWCSRNGWEQFGERQGAGRLYGGGLGPTHIMIRQQDNGERAFRVSLRSCRSSSEVVWGERLWQGTSGTEGFQISRKKTPMEFGTIVTGFRERLRHEIQQIRADG